MSTLADRSIAALRTTHDELAAVVPTLPDEQLTGPSGASEWTVAQVLSHLGSGAEIALAGYRAALDGEPAPGQDFNESVWDRWNALSPEQQATGFLEATDCLGLGLALEEALVQVGLGGRVDGEPDHGDAPQRGSGTPG